MSRFIWGADSIVVDKTIDKHAEHDQEDHGNWSDGDHAQDPRKMIDWDAWGRTWTDADKWLVDRYQGGAGMGINQWLRGTGSVKDADTYLDRGDRKMPTKDAITRLDALIASAPPLPKEAHVYRIMTRWPGEPDQDNTPEEVMDAFATEGTQFYDDAFTSTTADFSFIRNTIRNATATAQREPDKPAQVHRIMEIHLPKGTRAAFLPVAGNNAFKSEQEVLLPRGGTFTVRKVLGDRTVLDYEPPTWTRPVEEYRDER